MRQVFREHPAAVYTHKSFYGANGEEEEGARRLLYSVSRNTCLIACCNSKDRLRGLLNDLIPLE